jgi:hypothetical protein
VRCVSCCGRHAATASEEFMTKEKEEEQQGEGETGVYCGGGFRV